MSATAIVFLVLLSPVVIVAALLGGRCVAQTACLPFRRLAVGSAHRPPVINRRHGRLPVCATAEVRMKPIDVRNMQFAELQACLCGQRRSVLDAWRKYGPGTTRQLAQRSGIDLLNVRPRTTELLDLGAVVMDGPIGTEGVYRVRSDAEWRAWHRDLHLNGETVQPELALTR